MSIDALGFFGLAIAITVAAALAAVAGTCTFLGMVAWAFSVLEANQSSSFTDPPGEVVRGESRWLPQRSGWRLDRPAVREARGALATPLFARYGS
ncbi:MAG: hypothetical protein ACP5XB_06640 [Isosphaeraceae bacterium]